MGQSVNVFQSQPIFTSSRSKPLFVLIPFTEKVNRAVKSLLKYCPATAVRGLSKKQEKKKKDSEKFRKKSEQIAHFCHEVLLALLSIMALLTVFLDNYRE